MTIDASHGSTTPADALAGWRERLEREGAAARVQAAYRARAHRDALAAVCAREEAMQLAGWEREAALEARLAELQAAARSRDGAHAELSNELEAAAAARRSP